MRIFTLHFSLLLLLGIYASLVHCHDDRNETPVNLRGGLLNRLARKLMYESKEYKIGLDYFIMGFPKTGTTSLMRYFDSHDGMHHLSKDPTATKLTEWQIHRTEDMGVLFQQIEEEYLKSDKDKEKFGIKWPDAVRGKGLGMEIVKLLQEYNPQDTDTKLLIGLRHPVSWFESYYNYRAFVHNIENPPPTASLIGYEDWMGVCTDTARFEEGILQLGNLPLRAEDEKWMEEHVHLKVNSGGTPYKVFLYLEEQLGDDDTEQHKMFLAELSSFLELKKPFTIEHDVKRENDQSHKRYDICDAEHDAVREELVRNGKKTAEWFRSINWDEAEGYVLPNKEHFLSIIDTFGTDPCDEESTKQ